VAEGVAGPPEEPDPGALHVPFGVLDHRLEVSLRLRERGAKGSNVDVVETEERCAELGEELERCVHLVLGGRHRIHPRIEPGAIERSLTEHVGAGPSEGVPVAHRDPEVVLHALVENDPVGVIDPIRQFRPGTRP
jgi:hypothetical protein